MKIVTNGLIAVCLVVCGFVTGCTGMEVGAKLGVYRVDERQESQRTYSVPLKCYLWEDCSGSSIQNELK